MRVAILTVSDSVSRGTRADTSGDAIVAWAGRHSAPVAARAAVPDETPEIVRTLITWCDGDTADLVLTTGGTGLAERDVTPEATRAVMEREAPGISELLRASSVATIPLAALSRGVSGTRARTLIINLPGSPGGVRDGLAVLDRIIDHAISILRGETTSHDTPSGRQAAQSPAIGAGRP